MINTNAGAFPILDAIGNDESGHGYALRMAVANGLNGLPAVKAMLGKSRFTVLDATDGRSLGQWFGADETLLRRALGMTGIGKEPCSYEVGGIHLSRSYFVNRMQPRICASCLGGAGVCKLSWEVSANVACHIHGDVLLERCPQCLVVLSWDRPHLMQCRCGWHLTLVRTEPATEAEVEFSRWVEQAFESKDTISGHTKLGRLLAPLGLDAGLHVMAALATLERGHRDPAPVTHELRKRNSLALARHNLVLAEEALHRLELGKVPVHKPQRCSRTALELLAEAASCSYAAAERQLALSLLATLRAKRSNTHWGGTYPQLSQMDLF